MHNKMCQILTIAVVFSLSDLAELQANDEEIKKCQAECKALLDVFPPRVGHNKVNPAPPIPQDNLEPCKNNCLQPPHECVWGPQKVPCAVVKSVIESHKR